MSRPLRIDVKERISKDKVWIIMQRPPSHSMREFDVGVAPRSPNVINIRFRGRRIYGMTLDFQIDARLVLVEWLSPGGVGQGTEMHVTVRRTAESARRYRSAPVDYARAPQLGHASLPSSANEGTYGATLLGHFASAAAARPAQQQQQQQQYAVQRVPTHGTSQQRMQMQMQQQFSMQMMQQQMAAEASARAGAGGGGGSGTAPAAGGQILLPLPAQQQQQQQQQYAAQQQQQQSMMQMMQQRMAAETAARAAGGGGGSGTAPAAGVQIPSSLPVQQQYAAQQQQQRQHQQQPARSAAFASARPAAAYVPAGLTSSMPPNYASAEHARQYAAYIRATGAHSVSTMLPHAPVPPVEFTNTNSAAFANAAREYQRYRHSAAAIAGVGPIVAADRARAAGVAPQGQHPHI